MIAGRKDELEASKQKRQIAESLRQEQVKNKIAEAVKAFRTTLLPYFTEVKQNAPEGWFTLDTKTSGTGSVGDVRAVTFKAAKGKTFQIEIDQYGDIRVGKLVPGIRHVISIAYCGIGTIPSITSADDITKEKLGKLIEFALIDDKESRLLYGHD